MKHSNFHLFSLSFNICILFQLYFNDQILFLRVLVNNITITQTITIVTLGFTILY